MEPRRDPRMAGVSEIKISNGKGPPIFATVKDLSRSGICVCYVPASASAAFATGDDVSFQFRLPTGVVSGRGQVVWSQENPLEFGVDVMHVDAPEGDAALANFLGSDVCGTT